MLSQDFKPRLVLTITIKGKSCADKIIKQLELRKKNSDFAGKPKGYCLVIGAMPLKLQQLNALLKMIKTIYRDGSLETRILKFSHCERNILYSVECSYIPQIGLGCWVDPTKILLHRLNALGDFALDEICFPNVTRLETFISPEYFMLAYPNTNDPNSHIHRINNANSAIVMKKEDGAFVISASTLAIGAKAMHHLAQTSGKQIPAQVCVNNGIEGTIYEGTCKPNSTTFDLTCYEQIFVQPGPGRMQ